MTAAFDFKSPSLVVIGHWNAAILNEPGWIAKHILGEPEGKTVNLNAILVGNQVGPAQLAPEKQIWLFETFGMSCNGQRIEIFIRDIENLTETSGAIKKLTALLPHTPTRAAGVNFKVQITDDVAAITPSLATGEVFDSVGNLLTQERTDSIDIGNDHLLQIEGIGPLRTTLNLSRKTDFKTAEINFNFHAQLNGMEALSAYASADPIAHWQKHALKILAEVYGINEVGNTYF